MAKEFVVVHCDCRPPGRAQGVLFDAHVFKGLIRVRCPKCRRRRWVLGDGKRISLGLTDTAPAYLIKAS